MLKTKITSSLENCFLDSKIDEFKPLAKLTALKNERFSFQLLCVINDSTDPMKAVFSLKKDGDLWKYATVREVVCLPVTMPVVPDAPCDNYLRSAPGLYPDLLIPLRYQGKINLVKNNLCAIWVEIDLSAAKEDIAAGERKLTLTLFDESGNEAACESITVEIIDAELPPQTLKLTQWFYCDCLANYYNCEVWSEKHWSIIESFARTAKRNGINMLLTPVFTPSLDTYIGGERLTTQLVGVAKNENEYSFDYSLLERWIEMCNRVGIEYFEIAHFFTQWGAQHAPKIMATVDGEYKQIFGWDTDAVSPEYTSFLRTFIKSFLDYMKSRGDDTRCYFHISDEPHEDILPCYKAAKDSIADLLENYVIMDALSNYEFFSKGVVNTPIPCNDHIKPFIDNAVPGLWTYYCSGQWRDVSNRFLAMPSYRNRSIGMQMYKYSIVGFLHWGYNFYNTQYSYTSLNPYVDTCGDGWVPAGDTCSVYPAADGTALESMRIVVFHDALQDIRAMQLAESLCGKEKVVAVIEKAFGKSVEFDVCARSADEMLAVREAINELIKENL